MHCLETIFWIILFQELFDDDQVANTLESLAGTLKAAKKKPMPVMVLPKLNMVFKLMLPACQNPMREVMKV